MSISSRHNLKVTVFCFSFLVISVLLPSIIIQPKPTADRIAFAAYRHGQWDIYSIGSDGKNPRQLTDDLAEDTDPAYAPDGTKIAYVSRRQKNWDVYVLDLVTGEETRLTNSPHYDGAPTWGPDGEAIAYESFQAGNFDIWQTAASGGEAAINLTADSPAGDFAPAWSPDGNHIAFTSWRGGNKDLYLLNPSDGAVTRLTASPAAEEGPVWHPQGESLVFTRDELGTRELFQLRLGALPAGGSPPVQLTWLGRTDSPAWSPDGQTLAALFHRWDGQTLTLQGFERAHPLPRLLTAAIDVQGRLSWHSQAVIYGKPVATLSAAAVSLPNSLPYQEQISLNVSPESNEPYNLIRQNDLVVGKPWLADTVDDSFQAWRLRLREEVGYDFLRKLSDASRELGSQNDTSQYASWHKSGRAIDTLFDYYLGDGQLAQEIVREDYGGETYWRVYLRCVDQTGRCGRPVTANPWEYNHFARLELGPKRDEAEKTNLNGYYVDLTALAREYGWERISAYDDVDFSWRRDFLAFEYWHYENRLKNPALGQMEPVSWYDSMGQVYPQKTIHDYFTWQAMRVQNENLHHIALKGVPLPLEAKPWWVLVVQE